MQLLGSSQQAALATITAQLLLMPPALLPKLMLLPPTTSVAASTIAVWEVGCLRQGPHCVQCTPLIILPDLYGIFIYGKLDALLCRPVVLL